MTLQHDMMHSLRGKKIGQGEYRKVYECPLRPDLVVKIEIKGCSFSNIIEWETWKAVQQYPAATRWFAPCEMIAPCGVILFQKRTLPIPLDYPLPQKLPAFFADVCKRNFGILDGKLVCHDYGNTRLFLEGIKARNLVSVDWGRS